MHLYLQAIAILSIAERVQADKQGQLDWEQGMVWLRDAKTGAKTLDLAPPALGSCTCASASRVIPGAFLAKSRGNRSCIPFPFLITGKKLSTWPRLCYTYNMHTMLI